MSNAAKMWVHKCSISAPLANLPRATPGERSSCRTRPGDWSLDFGPSCMHHVCMRAVWDPDKAKANMEKHGVRFSDAELVLYDPFAVTVEDSGAQGEQRHISIGLDAVGRILVVVYTDRG